MASKVSERKSYFKFPLLQEKQRSVRVSDMQHQMGELYEELRRAKDERCRALEELAELKKMDGDFKDTIRPRELQDLKAQDSERKMLELMIFQTKLLEQTNISFEEAKLEIKNLKEIIRKIERSARSESKKVGAFDSANTQEEMMKLRKELRLALEAEDKSKKAMDDFAIALKEVSTDANQAKAQLADRQAELDKAIEEAKNTKSLLESTEQKLMDALNGYDKLKLEYEESVSASKAKEDSFLSCLNVSEEDITKWKQDNSRLNDEWKVAREDNTKLRQIMKEAVNEAIALKEAAEIIRSENFQMKDQLFEKGNSLQQIQQDYESLKVSEVAALDSVRELNDLLASTSVSTSKKTSNLSEFGSFRLPQTTNHDAKARRSLNIFSSEKWKPNDNSIWNGRRHSVGEQGMFNGSTFDREKSIESSSIMFSSLRKASDNRVPSSLFSGERGTINTNAFDHLEGIQCKGKDNMNVKKKKTIFGRLGDALRRISFHK
ncbi:hypothetical protein KFK09_020017 [Dendrobium nobile]|uniref:Uncharacterized protein n=1 Tax=Dendrobium nobile TaxID=94219 RepID=A0A8T3AR53_DENNO|nr:hypothetical protein KFK09_020017 [Dendrobium nobile]